MAQTSEVVLETKIYKSRIHFKAEAKKLFDSQHFVRLNEKKGIKYDLGFGFSNWVVSGAIF